MAMARPCHPLKAWMLQHFGRQKLRPEHYESFAALLPERRSGESLRQIVSGYRRPGWDLAFEMEAITGISAHDLRDLRWYGCAEKAA